jgi:hypothetical protein
MSQQVLEKFSQRIEPYKDLWQSVRITCLAVLHDEVWISPGVRVLLRESPPISTRIFIPVAGFVAIVKDFPMPELGIILSRMILEGFVPTEEGTEIRKVYLNRLRANLTPGSASTIGWFGPTPKQRQDALREFHIDRNCIFASAWGDRIAEVMDAELLDKLNSKLRLGDPSYDGLEALARELLPGTNMIDPTPTPIQIVAPLPFDLEYADSSKLIVRAPQQAADGTLNVRCFFLPKGGTLSQIVDLKADQAESSSWETTITWPKESERAKIMLFFREQEVGTVEVNRWKDSGNLRAVIDSYFDPQHERLKKSLLKPENKKPEPFETAVVRLFNVYGIPLVWYGSCSVGGRPDIAGVLLSTETPKLVLVGECTREKPTSKFSGLAERARELESACEGEAEVLPVVFTQAQTTESERQHAAEHGISLLGHRELEYLFGLVKNAPTANAIVQFLKSCKLGPNIPWLGR